MAPTRIPLALLAALFAGAVPAGAQEIKDGRLTMDVPAGPLQEVLQAIADAAGIEVEIEGELGDAEPQLIDGVPLDLAIRRLVGAHSLVMLHERGASRRLTEIRVYAVEEDPAVRRAESVQQARQAARSDPAREGARAGQPAAQDDRAARVQQVRELARSDSPESLTTLGQFVATDPDPAIRRLAVGALAGLGEEGAVDPIATALEDEDRAVRVQAVRALHNLLGDDVVPYLARVVEADDEVAVRMMAVQLAADLPSGQAVLERALADPDEEVRAAAAAALER